MADPGVGGGGGAGNHLIHEDESFFDKLWDLEFHTEAELGLPDYIQNIHNFPLAELKMYPHQNLAYNLYELKLIEDFFNSLVSDKGRSKQDKCNLGLFLIHRTFSCVLHSSRTHWLWSISYFPFVLITSQLFSLSFMYHESDLLKNLPFRAHKGKEYMGDYEGNLYKDLHGFVEYFVTKPVNLEKSGRFQIGDNHGINRKFLPHEVIDGAGEKYHPKLPDNLGILDHIVDSLMIQSKALTHIRDIIEQLRTYGTDKRVESNLTIMKENCDIVINWLHRGLSRSPSNSGLIAISKEIHVLCSQFLSTDSTHFSDYSLIHSLQKEIAGFVTHMNVYLDYQQQFAVQLLKLTHHEGLLNEIKAAQDHIQKTVRGHITSRIHSPTGYGHPAPAS